VRASTIVSQVAALATDKRYKEKEIHISIKKKVTDTTSGKWKMAEHQLHTDTTSGKWKLAEHLLHPTQ